MEQNMTIWQATRYCIVDKYASGKGRASRGEFFSYLFFLFLFCFFWLTFIIASIDFWGDLNLIDFVMLYAPFLFLPPLFAVAIRRLHDAGKSGWLVLLVFLPFLNIFLAGLLCMRGTPGWNRYGAPPQPVRL